MHPTHNTLPEDIRTQSVDLLNKHLAAAIDLQAQLKQAHWNVRGPAFYLLHELFDSTAGEVEVYTDLIASRVGELGGVAYGTVQMATEKSFLIPCRLDIADENEYIFAVSSALAAFGQSLRNAIETISKSGDHATVDVLTEIARSVDRQLWLVEAHEKPKSEEIRLSVVEL